MAERWVGMVEVVGRGEEGFRGELCWVMVESGWSSLYAFEVG